MEVADIAEKYCAFLRGINTGRSKIAMSELRRAFCGMGLADPRTVLATGNVVLSLSGENLAELKIQIENDLSIRFSYDAHVFIKSRKDIEVILGAARNIGLPKNCHLYVLVCDEESLPSELSRLFSSLPALPEEKLVLAGNAPFWIVPKGFTLKSPFGTKILGGSEYKTRLTSRNISTIEKVCALMQSM